MFYIDVTDSFLRWHGSPTGVQRTLIGLAEASQSDPEVGLCAWNRKTGIWHKVPRELWLSFFVARAAAEPAAIPAAPLAVKSSGGAIKWLRSLLFNLAPYGISQAWNRRANALAQAKAQRVACLPSREEIRSVQLASLPCIAAWEITDRVLVADSNWNQPGFLEALANSEPAPEIVGFVYDLIQLERVDFVGEKSQSDFLAWATELAKVSPHILCISEYSANAMRQFIEAQMEKGLKPRVRSIKFGNKVDSIPHLAQPLGEIFPDAPVHLAASQNWILWLGSVDRRKNLDVVLFALEPLYASGKLTMPLIVAGRKSHDGDYSLRKMREHPILKRHTYFIAAPSDEAVKALLAGAGLFIFSSWAEGYGLPVAEALQHGVPVITSNATSIPEVAGDLVDYFEPWDSRSLAELLERFESDPIYRKNLTDRSARFVPTSWDETLEDILNGSSKK